MTSNNSNNHHYFFIDYLVSGPVLSVLCALIQGLPSGLNLHTHTPPLPVYVNNVLLEQPYHFAYVSSMAALVLQWQSN